MQQRDSWKSQIPKSRGSKALGIPELIKKMNGPIQLCRLGICGKRQPWGFYGIEGYKKGKRKVELELGKT